MVAVSQRKSVFESRFGTVGRLLPQPMILRLTGRTDAQTAEPKWWRRLAAHHVLKTAS